MLFCIYFRNKLHIQYKIQFILEKHLDYSLLSKQNEENVRYSETKISQIRFATYEKIKKGSIIEEAKAFSRR